MARILLLIIVLLSGCGQEKIPEDLDSHIDRLIAEDKYENAIELLNEVQPGEQESKENILYLKEKVHLNYGLFLEYRGPEESSMRDRMTSALQQYIQVLKINPDNEKAREEIRQIMGVYSTMPDRSPGDGIVSELNKLGFNY